MLKIFAHLQAASNGRQDFLKLAGYQKHFISQGNIDVILIW
jgi:hypothetical protein